MLRVVAHFTAYQKQKSLQIKTAAVLAVALMQGYTANTAFT